MIMNANILCLPNEYAILANRKHRNVVFRNQKQKVKDESSSFQKSDPVNIQSPMVIASDDDTKGKSSCLAFVAMLDMNPLLRLEDTK